METRVKNVLNDFFEKDTIFQEVWDGIPDAILLVNEDGNIVWGNEKVQNLFGYNPEELIGSAIETLIPNRYGNHQTLRTDYMQSPHMRGLLTLPIGIFALNKAGEEISVTVSLKPIMHDEKKLVLTFVRDMTDWEALEREKNSLQEQLFQTQKMEALGQLTGGIAHDFNNILASAQGFTDLALAQHKFTDEKLEHYLLQVQTACKKGRGLIGQMMAFARKEKVQKQSLTLEPIVDGAMKMLHVMLPVTIEVDTAFSSNLPRVFFDSIQLHQVITNLCINARDAMSTHGRLEISLEIVSLTEGHCTSCSKVFSGEFVELKIKDTGPGIPKETLEQMFEPLFTTKESGKGTGMGLAVVHGIIHQHGGHILVESELGMGTTFRILLPPIIEAGEVTVKQ